jgi:hypothetical protein
MRIYVLIINIIFVIKIIQDNFYSKIDETKIIDCMLDSYILFIVRFVNMRIDKEKKKKNIFDLLFTKYKRFIIKDFIYI